MGRMRHYCEGLGAGPTNQLGAVDSDDGVLNEVNG